LEQYNKPDIFSMQYNHDRHPCLFAEFYPDAQSFGGPELVISTEWNMLASTLFDCPTAPIVLVCGEKSMGKSTLTRYVTNLFLNCHQEVAYLDLDVGQTEFTIPGVVSIHKICSPLLGPTYSHLNEPLLSYYFGATSPSADPELYLECIYDMAKFYYEHVRRDHKVPLVINTCGWMKGNNLFNN
jgi:polynucleotide 5'-kinase involved in rRNA processing